MLQHEQQQLALSDLPAVIRGGDAGHRLRDLSEDTWTTFCASQGIDWMKFQNLGQRGTALYVMRLRQALHDSKQKMALLQASLIGAMGDVDEALI